MAERAQRLKARTGPNNPLSASPCEELFCQRACAVLVTSRTISLSPALAAGVMSLKTFRPARKRIDVSVGESVRIIRDLQGYSQNELSRLMGIPQATLSAIENDRVRLGVERAKILG